MSHIARYSSPLGPITLAAEGEALTGLWFEGQAHFGTTLRGEERTQPLPVLQEGLRWLELYFSGTEPDFTPPVSLQGTPFQCRVWEALRAIPRGQVVTYGALAAALGSSPRAVGSAVARNPVSLIVPCHRVVGAGGALTGYAGGVERKRSLLLWEGAVL